MSNPRCYFVNNVNVRSTTHAHTQGNRHNPHVCSRQNNGDSAVWRHVCDWRWLTDWLTTAGFPIIFFSIYGFRSSCIRWLSFSGWWRGVGWRLPLENDVMIIHEAGTSVIDGYSRWPYLLYNTVIVASCVVPNCSKIILENGVNLCNKSIIAYSKEIAT